MSRYAAWKGTERRLARLLSGRRVGHLGGSVDVDAGWLQVSCKHRKIIPAWLSGALEQIRAAAGPERLGAVIVHGHGQPGDSDLVVVAIVDFLSWFGGDKR